MKLFDQVSTPHGKGLVAGCTRSETTGEVIKWLVTISKRNYLGNYPGIPVCDGHNIYILVSDAELTPCLL